MAIKIKCEQCGRKLDPRGMRKHMLTHPIRKLPLALRNMETLDRKESRRQTRRQRRQDYLTVARELVNAAYALRRVAR